MRLPMRWKTPLAASKSAIASSSRPRPSHASPRLFSPVALQRRQQRHGGVRRRQGLLVAAGGGGGQGALGRLPAVLALAPQPVGGGGPGQQPRLVRRGTAGDRAPAVDLQGRVQLAALVV